MPYLILTKENNRTNNHFVHQVIISNIEKIDAMKNIAILIAVVLIAASCSSSKKYVEKTIEVNFEVTITSDYCGGVPPNDRILEEIKTPKPYINKDVFISKDSILNDSMIQLSIDEKGKVTTSLSLGTYYVFLPSKVNSQLTVQENEVPCKKWKNKPNGTFDIGSKSEIVTIHVHKTCDPCGAARM